MFNHTYSIIIWYLQKLWLLSTLVLTNSNLQIRHYRYLIESSTHTRTKTQRGIAKLCALQGIDDESLEIKEMFPTTIIMNTSERRKLALIHTNTILIKE